MLLFGLRLGSHPRICVTTTPKPTTLLKKLMADPTTVTVRGSTHENRTHLAPTFLEQVIAGFEGTRLGQQEIYAEVLEITEGAWFKSFDVAKHVNEAAEFIPGLPVHLAIDAGTSQTTGAVWFQVRQVGTYSYSHRVTVFGDYCVKGLFSEANAKAIKAKGESLPCRGQIDTCRIDPASDQYTGIGVSAYAEYERVFGSRILARSPRHLVVDGLDQVEVLLDQGNLLIHPRCADLKAAFQNYARAKRGGEYLNAPAPDQSPYEDSMDALRYGIRSRFPEGRVEQPALRFVNARRIMG